MEVDDDEEHENEVDIVDVEGALETESSSEENVHPSTLKIHMTRSDTPAVGTSIVSDASLSPRHNLLLNSATSLMSHKWPESLGPLLHHSCCKQLNWVPRLATFLTWYELVANSSTRQ